MEGQEFRNVPVYRGGVKVPMKRPDFSQYNIFQFYPPGLCLRLGWYRVWCWSLRPWFVFEAFCVLCLCELRWQLFNLLNLRLTFQLFPQSWPSSSCSKRRESPSLPRRWRSIQTSNSKKIPWYCGGFTELNYSPLLDRKSITGASPDGSSQEDPHPENLPTSWGLEIGWKWKYVNCQLLEV